MKFTNDIGNRLKVLLEQPDEDVFTFYNNLKKVSFTLSILLYVCIVWFYFSEEIYKFNGWYPFGILSTLVLGLVINTSTYSVTDIRDILNEFFNKYKRISNEKIISEIIKESNITNGKSKQIFIEILITIHMTITIVDAFLNFSKDTIWVVLLSLLYCLLLYVNKALLISASLYTTISNAFFSENKIDIYRFGFIYFMLSLFLIYFMNQLFFNYSIWLFTSRESLLFYIMINIHLVLNYFIIYTYNSHLKLKYLNKIDTYKVVE